MLAIILSACLTNDPSVCKDYRISVDSNLDTTQCVIYAPPHFAQWAEEHPGWQIKRWRCTTAAENDI
jgi:hypothetical protein